MLVLLCAATGGIRAAETAAPERLPADKTCLDCHAPLFEKRNVHATARGDCSICHEHEGDRHSFRFVAAPDLLCVECHEIERRAVVHTPLRQGKCLACHDPHASAEPKLMRGRMTQVCGTCHEALKAPRQAHAHGPFAGGMCQACHWSHSSEHETLLVRPGSALCLECHDQFEAGGRESAVWHAPVRDDCSTCHSGHETGQPYMLLGEQPALCFECHDQVRVALEGAKVRHKAVTEERGCAACHEPHVSAYGKLLRSAGADLCLSCHDRAYEQAAGRSLANLKRLLEEQPNHHGPIREKSCEGCHEAHGAETFRLLKMAYPERFYDAFRDENYALCFACHAKEVVLEERSTTTNFRDGERNLHYLHVNRRKGRTCRACHEVHASGVERHLRETTPFGGWDLPVGFSRTEEGGRCASGCHVEVEYRRDR